MNPRVFKPEGLKHLDRVVDLVRHWLSLCLSETRPSERIQRADLSVPNTGSTPSSISTQPQEDKT